MLRVIEIGPGSDADDNRELVVEHVWALAKRSRMPTSMSSQKPEDETSRPPSSEMPSKGEANVRDEVTGAGKTAAGKTERLSVQKPPWWKFWRR